MHETTLHGQCLLSKTVEGFESFYERNYCILILDFSKWV